MREAVIRKLMNRLEEKPSSLFTCMQIQILMNMASAAFGRPGRTVLFSSAEEALKQFAQFTAENAAGADSQKLYKHAYMVGTRVRNVSGFTDNADLQRLVILLYRNIGITVTGSLPGEITIHDCYFSHIYSASQCIVMSAFDSGIIAGIMGGGSLTFTQRITEGCENCKACFRKGQENND